jgi:atypical dual specificity phosphatase
MGKAAMVMLAVVCFVIVAYDRAGDHESNFAGPTSEVHPNVPKGSGFWSFSIVVPDVLSRSGQPSMIDFEWLKDHGWKSIINLRTPDEVRWQRSKEFKEFNFNYLALPVKDNTVPSDKQVQEFLEFVTSPYNQPVHIYCHAGVGRTGVMIALYRYMIQGWPMLIAIIEAQLRGSGLNKSQVNWLNKWAKGHKPGSFFKQQQPKESASIEKNHNAYDVKLVK